MRKSVGAQVTWGVRFDDEAQLVRFVQQLAGEVAVRLASAKVKTRSIQVPLLRLTDGPQTRKPGR